MSHFTSIKVAFKDADSIIEAIQELGFDSPEIHQKAAHLYGYEGDKREEKANIILRRGSIGSLSNDLGFVLRDGEYHCVISEYDRENGYCAPGRGLGTSFLPRLKQGYALAQIRRLPGYRTEAIQKMDDGSIRVRLKVPERAKVRLRR